MVITTVERCFYMQVALILFTDIFNDFVAGFENLLVEPQYAMVGILAFFALIHSGLAFLRPYGAHSTHNTAHSTRNIVSQHVC